MKSVACVLLCVLVAVAAHTGFQQQQLQGQQYYPQQLQHFQSAPSGYNDYYEQPQEATGFLERISNDLRRQGLGDFFGGPPAFGFLPTAGVILVAVVGLALVGVLAYVANQLNNSGRGLDSDDWEVDHSVWMDQLQRDFENSWADQ